MANGLIEPRFESGDVLWHAQIGHENGNEVIQHNPDSRPLLLRANYPAPDRQMPARIQEEKNVALLELQSVARRSIAPHSQEVSDLPDG
jgi:hypothetical protein